MRKLSYDDSAALPFAEKDAFAEELFAAVEAGNTLLKGNGAGNDFLGWVDLPENLDRQEFARIKAAAARIREDSDILLVIGIGGSYLGARAATELLGHPFAGGISAEKRGGPQIIYTGNQLSTRYLRGLLDLLEGKRFSINVISKSGTTTEPAIAFRIFKQLLEERAGKKEAARRIYATTDKSRGALKTLADAEGYECFTVPDDVGGRFSVLTAVGLLPIAAAGIDIDALISGAAEARKTLKVLTPENPAVRYAALRHYLYQSGKRVEILANYEPGLHYFGEWWKQLFGESEGKDGKGLFPAAVDLTTDLHSMGQYIQDGPRMLAETVITVEQAAEPFLLAAAESDLDGLNYLAGRSLEFVNRSAMQGTLEAHTGGGVPAAVLTLSDLSAEALGELFYFFEFACGISGYLLGVNPFDQPGVERYKKNMFRLLGKPQA